MHKFIFRFRLKKSAILFNCSNFVVLFIPRFTYQKIDFLLFLFSLININIIEAMIIIEAVKNNQVFLDSILKFEKSKFKIVKIIAIIINIEDKFLFIIFSIF